MFTEAAFFVLVVWLVYWIDRERKLSGRLKPKSNRISNNQKISRNKLTGAVCQLNPNYSGNQHNNSMASVVEASPAAVTPKKTQRAAAGKKAGSERASGIKEAELESDYA